MKSLLITSKKKLSASIFGMFLAGFGIAVSSFYDQPIGTVLFSIILGFFLIFFMIQFLRQKEEAKYTKEVLQQLRSETWERNRALKFIYKYNFLVAGFVLLINAGMIIWGLIEAVNSSVIVFSIFFGVALCSSLIISHQGMETSK